MQIGRYIPTLAAGAAAVTTAGLMMANADPTGAGAEASRYLQSLATGLGAGVSVGAFATAVKGHFGGYHLPISGDLADLYKNYVTGGLVALSATSGGLAIASLVHFLNA